MIEAIGPANLIRVALFVATAAVLAGWPRLLRVAQRAGLAPFPVAFLLVVVTRLGFFAAWYLWLKEAVPNDAGLYYGPWAEAALRGELPGRDIVTNHNPLFVYALAGLYRLVPNPLVFPAATAVLDIGNFLVWTRIVSRVAPPAAALLFPILYALDPTLLSYSVSGQDETLFLFGFGLSMLLWLRHLFVLSGLVFGVAFLADKFFSVILAFGTVVREPRRLSRASVLWLGGFAVALLPVYGYFAARGVDLLYPVEANAIESGYAPGGLPYLLTAFGLDIVAHARACDVLTLLANIAAALVLSVWPSRPRATLRDNPVMAGGILFLIFTLVARKPCYEIMGLIAIYALLAEAFQAVRAGWVWAIYSLLAALNQSLWFHLVHLDTLGDIHGWATTGETAAAGLWLFFAFQTVFVAYKIGLLILALRTWLAPSSRKASSETPTATVALRATNVAR